VQSSGATVAGNAISVALESSGGLKEGIWVNGSDATVRRNKVVFSGSDSTAGIGILVESAGSSALLEYNEISTGGKGILINTPGGGSVQAKYNLIDDCITGIEITNGSDQTLTNNTVGRSTCISGSVGILFGTTFVDNAPSDFTRNLVANTETGFQLNRSSPSGYWYFADNAYWDDSQSCGSPADYPYALSVSELRGSSDPHFCAGRSETGKYSYRIDSDMNIANPGSPLTVLVGALGVECACDTLEQDTVVPTAGGATAITVLEDVFVPSGKTLTIGGNVSFLFDDEDESNSGADGNLDELIVEGELDVQGASGSRSSFRSQAGSPNPGDWYGIVVGPGGSADLDYVDIADATVCVSDMVNSPAGQILLNETAMSNFETAGVYLYPSSQSTNEFNEAYFTIMNVDMGGAPYGLYFRDNGHRAYNVRVDSVTVSGNGTGTYGIYLNVHGQGGSAEADVDRLIVEDLTSGTGIRVAGYSPIIENTSVTHCLTGVKLEGTASPEFDNSAISDCILDGLYVNGASTSADVDVHDLTISDCNPGLSTEGYGQGTFVDVDISGGDTGMSLKASGAHTFRQGNVLGFSNIGVSTNSWSGIDLGDSPGDQGNNNIFSAVPGVISYVKVKPKVAGYPDIMAEGNYWGTSSPDSTLFVGGGVDYSPFLSDSSTLAKEILFAELPTPPFLLAGPNPFRTSLSLQFAIPEQGEEFRLQIFDIAGRLVREWQTGAVAAGIKTIEWDGRSNTGRSVGSGIYFIRYQAGEFKTTAKVVRLAN
jgi:hypothetical protein